MSEQRRVRLSREGDLTRVTLNRPEKANAYDRAMLEALDEAFGAVDTPVLVLDSAGEGAFCGGADLSELGEASPEQALDLYSQAVFERLARAPFVSIAVVQGAAMAGGFELALACDLRVVGPRARFGLPETGLGIVPSAGGCTRLPRVVGPARAKEIILGGRVLDAESALSWGIAQRLGSEPLAEALAWGSEIARRDPMALRLAKALIDGVDGLGAERIAEALLYSRRAGKKRPG